MLPSTVFAALLAVLPLAAAGPHRANSGLAHGHVARAAADTGAGAGPRPRGTRRRRGQQCRPRPKPEQGTQQEGQQQAPPAVPGPSETAPETQNGGEPQDHQQQGGDQHQQQGGEWKPEQPAPSPPAEQNQDQNNNWAGNNHLANEHGGFISATGPCGDPQADANSPNGQRWWLECGLDAGGWNPPFLTFDMIKMVPLTASPPYEKCEPFFDRFYQYGAQYGIPPMVLAAIASQESGCDPTLPGNGGEHGLMQLLGVNCDGAPGGDCKDVDFNIRRAAEYLRERIDANGGSVLLGLGQYNGWSKDMTKATVDEKAWRDGCWTQPNMDYMDQMLNGWLQGKYGYDRKHWDNRKWCGA